MRDQTIVRRLFQIATLALSAAMAATPAAIAGNNLPVVLVSSSSAFDKACPRYYRQGNDQDVLPEVATEYCTCIAGNMDAQGLGSEVMDFLARTYSEDLTTFIDQYPNGEAWMQAYFAAEEQCKNNTDYGSNQPPDQGGNGGFPMEAGSWGGIVRAGPGQEYARVATLAEGESITLLENTGVYSNDYPWFKIRYRGGREGYQWGGIVCGYGAPIEGAFETCR